MVERSSVVTTSPLTRHDATSPEAMVVDKIGFYLSTAEGGFQYVMAARLVGGFPILQIHCCQWFNRLRYVVIGYMIYHKIMISVVGNGHFVGARAY